MVSPRAQYTSMPRESEFTQQLAMESLVQYASSCRYFLIVAPDVPHSDSGKDCNLDSYARQGLCRLELWARLVVSGVAPSILGDPDDVVISQLDLPPRMPYSDQRILHFPLS